MQAMILAAGMGSRLKHITSDIPKCLVEVDGRSVLEWNIEKLKNAGISRVVINLHHRATQVMDFLDQNNDFGITILRSHEPELLNTGGGIKNAESLFLATEPIIIINADILSGVNLLAMRDFHSSNDAMATLMTRSPEDDRVLLFHQKTGHLYGWQNASHRTVVSLEHSVSDDSLIARGFCGIQVISPKVLDFFAPSSEKESSISGYLRAVSTNQKVLEFQADTASWFDIGTPEQLSECREHFSRKDVLGSGSIL
ncbi:MAG: nucleotidyltransferase family protein [Bdellovibrionota bacterium]|jgi:NDP-sugar pyrophosphorylase family protein